jgi:hypothetical protein
MEKYLQEKYGTNRVVNPEDVDNDDYDDITRQALLPSPKEPNLWFVCKQFVRNMNSGY